MFYYFTIKYFDSLRFLFVGALPARILRSNSSYTSYCIILCCNNNNCGANCRGMNCRSANYRYLILEGCLELAPLVIYFHFMGQYLSFIIIQFSLFSSTRSDRSTAVWQPLAFVQSKSPKSFAFISFVNLSFAVELLCLSVLSP